MSIKIPISADFNGDAIKNQIAQVNAAIQRMGDTVAKANGQKFEPITLSGKDDLKYFVQQTEKLLKVQGELRNRMKSSGQEGKNPMLANWNHLYLNENARLKRQQEMLVFLGGSFSGGSAPSAAPSKRPHLPQPANHNQPQPRKPSPWAAQGANVLQSGLSATGPVGGVASSAVGTGMSAGFGAGLMGLVGGIAALGVGKLIGSVTEKIDQAEQNNVAYDTLKRTLGDVNVSFGGLKTLIHESGNNLGITFDEVGKLSTQFAKAANLSGDDYQQLAPELSTGVGLARGLGLDPMQTMGVMGGMRGVGVTNNDQESRKMAVLIGETIGKADAFAKSSEVLDAIAGYATAQTRNALSAANISGYAGTLSALAGSGIPGLDPAGAGGMISRINASLSAGGANGEASQFFSSMVANRMGLDPIQMAIMREGGAFATNDQMFGSGSAASRYGVGGPKGGSTFLEETMRALRSKYSEPGMLAMATSNHLGIGMNQAMSLLSVKPNEMGALQKGLAGAGIDMADLNSAGIASLAKVFTGSDSDRSGVADSLYRRTGKDALSSAQVDDLKNVMAGGDIDMQKKMLAELVSSRSQEETTGSLARDSKNILDNIKTAVSDKLIPLVTEMRHGIMAIAGVGKDGVTARSLQEMIVRSEFDDKNSILSQQYQSRIDVQNQMFDQARLSQDTNPMPTEAEMKLPLQQRNAAIQARIARALAQMEAAKAEATQLKSERDAQILQNNQAADQAVRQMNGGSGTMGKLNHSIIAQIESGGRHVDENGNTITSPVGALGIMQTMPGTLKDPGFGVLPARDDTHAEMQRVGEDYADAMMKRYGSADKALAAYNWGPGSLDKALSKHGDDWFAHAPSETRDYVNKYHKLAAKLPEGANGGAPVTKPATLPADEAGRQSSSAPVNFGPLAGELNVNLSMAGELSRLINPPKPMVTNVSASRPFGS